MKEKTNFLAQYLEKEGISQKHFAKKIGVSEQMLSYIVNKKNFIPTLKMAAAIEKASYGKLPITIWLSNEKDSIEVE